MALRRAARGRVEGGVRIQALRQGDARVAAAVSAIAAAGALTLGAYLGAREEAAAGLVALVGCAVLAAGLALRRGLLVTTGLALVGAGYGVSLIGRDLDGAAALFSAGFVLAAELAYWAIEPGAAVRLGRRATSRRAFAVGVIGVAGGVLGALLLAAGATPLEGGSVFGVLGVAAVLAVAASAVWLIHSLRDGSDAP